jgi:glutathione S-transferase
MIQLFSMPLTSGFAARCALEEAGAPYELIEVDPNDRSRPPEFAAVTPMLKVPALREGDLRLYELGAILAWSVDRFPEAALGPAVGDPARAYLYRWLFWCSNTLHVAYEGFFLPSMFTDDEGDHPALQAKAVTEVTRLYDYVESELAGRDWAVGNAFTVADLYLYMLRGWGSFLPEGATFGGSAVAEHFERVGARPAVARVRAAEGIDENFNLTEST